MDCSEVRTSYRFRNGCYLFLIKLHNAHVSLWQTEFIQNIEYITELCIFFLYNKQFNKSYKMCIYYKINLKVLNMCNFKTVIFCFENHIIRIMAINGSRN